MIAAIVLILAVLVVIVGVVAGVFLHDEDARLTSFGVAGVALLVFLVVAFFSCVATVGTKEFGIETTFGKPTGVLTNGFHIKAPWQDVTDMDAAIQTDSHTKSEGGCITARIAHQATACVDVSIRWRIKEGAADSLFQNYRDFNNVRDSLVTRDLNAAVNAAVETYDPLDVDANGNSLAPSLASLASGVQDQMSSEVGDQIDVLGVIIPVLHFDDSIQGRINALQAQIAQTRIAAQSISTANDQARANAALARSVAKDPNVLVSKCLDLLNEAITKGYPLPAGFNCMGGGSALVVPAK